MSATNDAERAAYPALPHPQGEIEQAGGWKQPTQFFTAEQMHAYVDADRKERQLAACNFCLAEAAKARAALPIDFKQAIDQGGWQLVPKSPTPAMLDAVMVDCVEAPDFLSLIRDQYAEDYCAMLAAAPTLLGVADGDAVGGKSGGVA